MEVKWHLPTHILVGVVLLLIQISSISIECATTSTPIPATDTISPNATFANCPADVITNNGIVNYTEPTASDGVGDLNVSCDPPSGSNFTENEVTTVNCTAFDDAGNEADEFCIFSVTVDTISPNATFANCPADVITNNIGIVNYTEPTASDGVDNLNVSCYPPSGSNFAENEETTVNCTAFDDAGNEAYEFCIFFVTVDTISPNATFANCPADVITNNIGIVNYTEPTASDGVDNLNVSCYPPSGSNFAENEETTVNCTAFDDAGNEADVFCIFSVTVDTISPNATFANCPADVITNNIGIVNYTEPTASDGVDNLNVSCYPPSGSNFAENEETTVNCTAFDDAGNEADVFCIFSVTVDTISPNATFANCPADVITNNGIVNYTEPTDSDGVDDLNVSCYPPSASNFTENEVTTVNCRAFDDAGNEADEFCIFFVTVDTISPNATFANCPADVTTNNGIVNYTEPTASDGVDNLNVSCYPPSGSNFAENEETTVNCTAFDDAGNEADVFCIFSVTVDTISPNATFANCPADVITNNGIVNYTEPTASDGVDNLNVSCYPPSGSNFAENEETTVNCRAFDDAGNEASEICKFHVTFDTIPPYFTFCPKDTDHFADAGTNSTVVTWENPTATDNLVVEGFPTVKCSPESGSRFEIGETSVSCIASDAAGNERDTNCSILISVAELSAPIIANITEVTNETMLITWTSADEVENFAIVYIGASESEGPLNVTVTGEETSYVLTELLSGETYTVTVIGESGLAFAESEQRTATTELNAPTITSTSSAQMTSLRIEWSSPPKDIVRQYNITYTGVNEDLKTRSKMEDSSSTSTTLEGLLSGETYELTVTASSGSLVGMEVSATSAEKSETTIPRNVTLEESNSTVSSVTVQWSPPTEPESTLIPVIEFYRISCSDGQASPETVNFSESEITASCVNFSTAGAVYVVTVSSHSLGKVASSSLMIIALPNGVVLHETQPTTTTTVSAMWSNPAGKADSFEIECSSGEPIPPSIPIGSSNMENTASCVDLPSPGKAYFMTVFVNSGGKKNSSTHIQLRALPESVEGLRVKEFTNTEAVISWRTPVNCATCFFTSFKAFRADEMGQPKIINYVTGQTDYETPFDGLVAGTEYTFTVISQSENKESIPSNTTQRIKPSPVTGFEAFIAKATSIEVSWKDVDGVKDKYTLSIQPQDGTLVKPNPLDTTAVFTDLKPVTLYTINVTTISGQQKSDPYLEKIQTIPDIPVPPADKPSNPTKATTTSFVVELKDSYFSHVNGEIQNYTVIVAQQANSISSVPVPDPAATWAAAQAQTPIPPYQAFLAQAYPFPSSASSTRKKRQVFSPESIQIGVDDCSPGDDVYCNGHLRDDTNYIYLFRVWNDAGYTDSPFSQPIRTDNDTTLEVGLGVGLPLSILFIIFIVLLLLVIRRRRQLQQGGSATAYANEAFSTDVQMPLRKRANSRPIQLENFPEHYRVMKADSDYLFSEEYEELRAVGRDQSTDAALQDVNRTKNRFVNILPYDHSRVKLSQVDDEEGSDYINANFIPGFNSPREFIACQGPLPGTVDDIWRLAWEQRVSTIVMVTQLVEKGRVKCHRYWPVDDEPVCFGEIVVTLLSEKVLKQWTVREFKLEKGEKNRKLRHFNFTDWPDHGVPENSEGILRFVRSIRNQIPKNRRPTIVHCSAGVGRTGTFITLDRITQHLKENEYVDVFGTVSEMRMHRNYMVQTERQYIFIHDCIINLLQGRPTNGEAHREIMV